MNEGFLYNRLQHRNVLKFRGVYMNEIRFNTGFDESSEDRSLKRDNDEEEKDQTNKLNLGSNQKGVSYQVGIITEVYSHISLNQYLSFYASRGVQVHEDIVWSILIQLSDVMSTCQKQGFWHHELNPHTIFVREDHKTLALSYFGKAKLIGIIKKEQIRYLAPNQLENSQNDSKGVFEHTCKDDVYSVGCIVAAICAIGETNQEIIHQYQLLNKDQSGDHLKIILDYIKSRGYSQQLTDILA